MTPETLPDAKAILDILNKHFPPAQWTAGEWTSPPDIEDFVFQFGCVAGALLYARLFVPALRIVEGVVILDEAEKPEEFLRAIAGSKIGLRELAASFNWIDVPYIFSRPESDREEERVLAEAIAEAWRGRLARLFPDRIFVVDVMSQEETGGGIGVGFREVTGGAAA